MTETVLLLRSRSYRAQIGGRWNRSEVKSNAETEWDTHFVRRSLTYAHSEGGWRQYPWKSCSIRRAKSSLPQLLATITARWDVWMASERRPT